MSGLEINTDLVRKILVGFIANETRKVGFERGVVAVSGGVDSAVVAYLATEALGPQSVMAIWMPYKTSSAESERDAKEVIGHLGIGSLTVDISPMVDAYFREFPDASKMRRANKMARERMTIAYDHSARLNALVIGTSNKTELLLGYGTLYGDMASAINPIGDLYKTQLRQLARAIGVPKQIIEKDPTADLWPGQTDEGELGFTYAEVDRLLYHMVDERHTDAELAAAGFDPKFVARIRQMIQRSHFKRMLPVIAKISERTIDRDFRYARDWGR
ncbi:MAG: NAD+ synthase [Planctomycetes bacterium]|nr:NAD+ synthase [Planctomycetota bacterium]MBM4079105.1 NAD+ synthase [Planctomycetota bacterium]MBM4085016.1 NAD+ synthase [Planctomycetota bacterium]